MYKGTFYKKQVKLLLQWPVWLQAAIMQVSACAIFKAIIQPCNGGGKGA